MKSAATIDRGWNRQGRNVFLLKRDVIEPGWSNNKIRLHFYLGGLATIYRLQRTLRGLILPGNVMRG